MKILIIVERFLYPILRTFDPKRLLKSNHSDEFIHGFHGKFFCVGFVDSSWTSGSASNIHLVEEIEIGIYSGMQAIKIDDISAASYQTRRGIVYRRKWCHLCEWFPTHFFYNRSNSLQLDNREKKRTIIFVRQYNYFQKWTSIKLDRIQTKNEHRSLQ